jgi:hypothetical protein
MIIKNVSTDVFAEMYDLAIEEETNFRLGGVRKTVQLQGHKVRLFDSVFMSLSNAVIRVVDAKYRIEFVKYHERLYVIILTEEAKEDKSKFLQEIQLEETPEYVQDIVNICAKRIENESGLNV